MTLVRKVGIIPALLVAAIALSNREVWAQQSAPPQTQAPSLLDRLKAELALCKQQYPNRIKQAIAYATCENQVTRVLLKPRLPNPDLVEQEMTYNLVLAEKVQKGKMTLIEKEAAAAQQHSEMVAEAQRRELAKATVAQQRQAPAQAQAPSTVIIDNSPPPVFQSDAPKLQNILPQQTRCQTMRVGMMLQTVCN
jgi:hypothetical protein